MIGAARVLPFTVIEGGRRPGRPRRRMDPSVAECLAHLQVLIKLKPSYVLGIAVLCGDMVEKAKAGAR